MKAMMILILFSMLTSACSPVNSMTPFDDQQAAIVAKSMMRQPVIPAKAGIS